MKKKLLILTTVLSATALLLSSCLKDKSHYVNFGNGGTFVDFPYGGFVNFNSQAITETPDTDANGSITREFAVNVASANLPTSPTTVTLAVGGASDVTTINKLQSNVVYEMLPANAYSFTTTKVTVPAGQQYANTTITFYKNLLDPAKSYVLPIYIKDGGGQKISTNLNVLYYHFIGNDFAGVYEHYFDRWSTPDTVHGVKDNPHVDEGPETFYPVSPTEFQVITWYYTQPPYTVTFVKNGPNDYSNFQVDFAASDIADYFTPGGIVVTHHPEIRPQDNPADNSKVYDPNKHYTYAEALKLFRFYYTTGTRGIIDSYFK